MAEDDAKETTDEENASSEKAKEASPAELKRPGLGFLVIASVISLALDLGSKEWATMNLVKQPGQPRPVVVLIDGALQLVYAENRGAAWGILENQPDYVRLPFFFAISILAVLFIVSLYRRLAPTQTALKWGLPMVLGGALGNLVDRIRYGHVVDFIDAYATIGGEVEHWPTFNIADVAIVAGVILLGVDMFTHRKSDDDDEKEGPSSTKQASEPPTAEDADKSDGDEAEEQEKVSA